VELYEDTCRAAIAAKVEDEIAKTDGLDAYAVLMRIREQRSILPVFKDHPLPEVVRTPLSVPFNTQVSVLLQRKLALLKRDKKGPMVGPMTAAITGFIVGIAYQGVGNEVYVFQMGYCMFVLLIGGMGGMNIMPALITERRIMLRETSSALYSNWAHVLVSVTINTLLSFVGLLVMTIISFSLTEMKWEHYPLLMKWCFVMVLTYDGLWGLVSTYAEDITQAQMMSMPALMIFNIYNGFMVRKAVCPVFMLWAMYSSPCFWCLEAMACDIYDDGTTQGNALISEFGFVCGREYTTFAVCLSIMTITRCIQIYGLGKSQIAK